MTLLGLKIVFFTLLGGLTAGAAGWFCGPLAFEGPRTRHRLLGWCGLILGAVGCLMLWGWGLFGNPLALYHRGLDFFRLLFG